MGAVIASPRLNCPTASGLPKRASSTRIPHCVPTYTTLPSRVQLKLSRRELVGSDSAHSRSLYPLSRTVLRDIGSVAIGHGARQRRANHALLLFGVQFGVNRESQHLRRRALGFCKRTGLVP